MKNLVLTAGLLALTGAAFADAGYRTFSFSADPAGAVGANYGGSPATISAMTTLCVPPFLYIGGNLATTVVIDGWGDGAGEIADGSDQYIDVYHNYDLRLVPSGFGVGLPSSVNLYLDFDLVGEEGGSVGVDPIWTPAATMNAINPFFSPVDASTTGGHFKLLLRKKVEVTDELEANGGGINGTMLMVSDAATVTVSAW